MASTGHQDQVEVERWTLDVRVLNGNVLADAGYIFLHNFPTGKSSETQNRTVKLSKNSSASRLSPSLKALAKRMWHFMSCIYSTAMQICTWYYISLSWLLIKIAHTKDYSSEPQNLSEKGSMGHSTVPLVQRMQYHAHRERHSRLATASKHHDGGSLDQSNTGLGKLYADRWVGSLTSDSSWTYRNAVQVLGRGNRKKQWQSRAYRVIAVQGLPCTSEPDLDHQIFSILDTTYLVSSVYHGWIHTFEVLFTTHIH